MAEGGEEMTDMTDNYEISISSSGRFAGFEKIEPMKIALGSFIGDTFGQDTRLAEKLNEVIEKVNRIMEVMNRR